MDNPIINAFRDDDLKVSLIEHEDELQIGVFNFAPDLPIPIGVESNDLAHENWLDIPFPDRGELPKGYEESPEKMNIAEILKAYSDGHLPRSSPDYRILADHVGRCLLILINYQKDIPDYDKYVEVFLKADMVKDLYDRLLRSGKEFYNQAMYVDEDQQDLALRMTVICRTLYYGAHLLSPTTPGILYELGTVSFDLGDRFLLDNAEWKVTLYIQSADFLEMALASEDIQNGSPAFYLLGLIRQHLGNEEGAKDAYKRFLDKVPDKIFRDIRFIVKDRLEKLS